MLSIAVNGTSISSAHPTAALLPSATSVINLADSNNRAAFNIITRMKEEPMDVESLDATKEEVNAWALYGQCLWIWV